MTNGTSEKLKDVPGVFSQGATLDDLAANIRDAHHVMVDADPALARPGIRRKDIAVQVT